MVSVLVLLASLGAWVFPAASVGQENYCIAVEPDPETLLDPEDFPPAPTEGFGPAGPAAGVCTDDGRIIDVLVLYTPAARVYVEQIPAAFPPIEELVVLSIVKLNEALAISQIPTYARLVGMGQVPYDESSDTTQNFALECLRSSACMPLAHFLRNRYRADVVTLLIAPIFAQTIGLADHLGAFNVVQVDFANSNGLWVLTHEIGHNLGAGHQGGGTYPRAWCHAYEYDGPGVNDAFRTVMTRTTSPKILNFSNPNVLHEGVPTGVFNSANNARCIGDFLGLSARNKKSDCNLNGICDSLDIANQTSSDCEHDGVPDECYNPLNHPGGCCINGTCVERTQGCCLYQGGTFTDWSCEVDSNVNGIPDACDSPLGACCRKSGCEVIVRSSCISMGGNFKGDGSRCGDDGNSNGKADGCDAGVLGACCLNGLTCSEILETSCTSLGGAFGGAGTVCEDCNGDGLPAVCQPFGASAEYGACCESSGNCTIRTACSCHGTVFHGAHSVCTPNLCPAAP